MTSGVRLGWMLNPQDQQVEIYCLGQAKEVRTARSAKLSLLTQLSGEAVLPDFVLQVDRFTED